MGVEDRVLAELERGASAKHRPEGNPFQFEHAMPFGLLRVVATGPASASFASVGPLRFEGREVNVKGTGARRDGAWVVEELETTLPNAKSLTAAVGREKVAQLQDALGRNLARAASDHEVVFHRRALVALLQERQEADRAIERTRDEIAHREARLAIQVEQRSRMDDDHPEREGRILGRIAEIEAAVRAASDAEAAAVARKASKARR